jgi:hypothetical protein
MTIADYLNSIAKDLELADINNYLYSTQLPHFTQTSLPPCVLYLIKRPMPDSKIILDSHVGNIGDISYVYSESLHIGYLFEIRKKANVIQNHNYFIAASTVVDWSALKNTTVRTILSNTYINITLLGEEILFSARKKLMEAVFLP